MRSDVYGCLVLSRLIIWTIDRLVWWRAFPMVRQQFPRYFRRRVIVWWVVNGENCTKQHEASLRMYHDALQRASTWQKAALPTYLFRLHKIDGIHYDPHLFQHNTGCTRAKHTQRLLTLGPIPYITDVVRKFIRYIFEDVITVLGRYVFQSATNVFVFVFVPTPAISLFIKSWGLLKKGGGI